MELDKKIIWITGASSGIGAALAKACHVAGARLILSARRADRLAEVASQCPGAAVLPMDMTELEAMPTKVEEAQALFGGLDVLVNNAGVSQRSLALETTLDVTRTILETNFIGPVCLTRLVLPGMIQAGGGMLVTVSSVLGKFGARTRSSYSASKHALHGYFDSLRDEHWRDGIKVLMVCPGYIKTEVSMNAFEADGSRHGELDPGQEQGMDANLCARKMVNAMRREKEEVLIGGREIYGVLLKRYAPGLFTKILRRNSVD